MAGTRAHQIPEEQAVLLEQRARKHGRTPEQELAAILAPVLAARRASAFLRVLRAMGTIEGKVEPEADAALEPVCSGSGVRE